MDPASFQNFNAGPPIVPWPVQAYATPTIPVDDHLFPGLTQDFAFTNDPLVPLMEQADAPPKAISEVDIEPPPGMRIARAKWDEHKPDIEQNYAQMPLKGLRILMATKGFKASEQQWKKKMAEWGFNKNMTRRVAKAIAKSEHRRQSKNQKKVKYRYLGKQVHQNKIKQFCQDYPNNPLASSCSLPSKLSIVSRVSTAHKALSSKSGEAASGDREGVTGTKETIASDASTVSTKPEFFNGQTVDDLLAIQKYATKLSRKGNYPSAKLAFSEALEGLETLLGPINALTFRSLVEFAQSAVHYEDFGEATQRLRKSYNEHQEELGDHPKTWLALAQLGHVYLGEKKHAQALQTFIDAKMGLERLTTWSLEELYSSTSDLIGKIIDIQIDIGDFGAAAKEFMARIEQAKALGDAYIGRAADLQHGLIHLYNHDGWHRASNRGTIFPPPIPDVERLSLELTRYSDLGFNAIETDLCALNQLCLFFERTRQPEKLTPCLKKMGSLLINGLAASHFDPDILYHAGNVALSYSSIHDYESAEWWLLCRKRYIERPRSPGPHSKEALSNLMQLAKLYFDQFLPGSAEPVLTEAKKLGQEILPLDHTFHHDVEMMILEGKWNYSCCKMCGVSRAGFMEDSSEPEDESEESDDTSDDSDVGPYEIGEDQDATEPKMLTFQFQ